MARGEDVRKLKFKYQKTIKHAEFVHADLEYHEEVIHEAKKDFQEEISKFIARLSPEERERLRAKNPTPKSAVGPTKEISEEIEENVNECFALIPSEAREETTQEKDVVVKQKKSSEIKKLYRRIAEETHPDKVAANGFSDKEVNKRSRIFKKANAAFKDNNWYVLHSIALDLDIPLPKPSDEQIAWVEEDIHRVKAQIAALQNYTAWHWYTGDDAAKRNALKHYFDLVHSFTHPNLG